MKNKELIVKEIKRLGFKLGCWNTKIDTVPKKEITKVIESLDQEYTDVQVLIRGKEFIVEIATIDDEKDLNILSASAYEHQYGRKCGE